MPTQTEVLDAIGDDCDYEAAGARLQIPAGQAYLIATGLPADGGDTFPPDETPSRPGRIKGSTQQLVYQRPRAANPIQKSEVQEWIRGRAAGDGQMVAAARSRDAEPGRPRDTDDTDVCHVLTRQHDLVTALMEQLKAIPGVTKGGSEVHQSRRKSIVDMMTVELSKHETAEQEHFWPAVRDFFSEGEEILEQALEQEREGKDSLVALGRTEPSEERFDELVEELEKRLRKHVAFEDKVLLSVWNSMPEEDRRAIGERILQAEQHAPTRPHPHAPEQPAAAVKAAAASAAPLDKARDALGNRPAKRRGRAAEEPNSPTEEER